MGLRSARKARADTLNATAAMVSLVTVHQSQSILMPPTFTISLQQDLEA